MFTTLEQLEHRRMFAASGWEWEPTIPNPVPFYQLTISGTAGDDSITLSQSGNVLTVNRNGVTATHDLNGITRIVVSGLAGNDTIAAQSNVSRALTLYGNAGSDSLSGGAGHDRIYGGSGFLDHPDELDYDIINGGAGDDTLYAPHLAHGVIHGNAGNDTLHGGAAGDYLYGDENNDTIYGGNGADWIYGGAGNDHLFGQKHNDHLYGQAGFDTLRGADVQTYNEYNTLFGGADGDTLLWSPCHDEFNGGSGFDTVDFRACTYAVTLSLDNAANDGSVGGGSHCNVKTDNEVVIGTAHDDLLTGHWGPNYLYGMGGNDTLRGGGDADQLWGGNGDDSLFGDAGDDLVYGEAGNDHLHGGAGADDLHGGADHDTLVAIGGGTHDNLFGNAGYDRFWMDAEATETHDAAGFEISERAVNRVGMYQYGLSKDAVGADIADPNPTDFDDGMIVVPTYEDFSHQDVFTGVPAMTDIDQGRVGTCALLSSLAAVANSFPRYIQNMIVDLGDGTAAVRLYQGGNAQYVRVDKELAVDAQGNIYYATNGTTGAMWAPLIEKALASMEGNLYFNVNGMTPQDGFNYLGLSNVSIWSANPVGTLMNIRNALLAGQAVTVATPDDAPEVLAVPNHGFAVQSVAADFSSITVYNPWGDDGVELEEDAEDGFVTYTMPQFFAAFNRARAAWM